MSEIAEELERMAKVFDDEGDVIVRESPSGSHASGHGYGKRAAASALRARAAELRAQRSAPTYAPQPKPRNVTPYQWWMLENDQPVRISHTGINYAFSDAVQARKVLLNELLTDARWLYLGDGPEPARR